MFRLLIFGAGNHELEFIGCLTYCLLQLSSNMKIALDSHMRTTWHVNPSGDLESRDDRLTTHQGIYDIYYFSMILITYTQIK